MDMHITRSAHQADVTLTGAFTFAEAMPFKQVLAITKESHIRTIALNFAQVDFVDSAALGMLMLLRNGALETGQHIILQQPYGQVEKVFRLSRFDSLFTIAA